MQQMVVDGFLRMMSDDRLQNLITDFYALRGQLCVTNQCDIQCALKRLFAIIRVTMQDQHTLSVLKHSDGAPLTIPSAAQILDALTCVSSAEQLVLGPAFEDSLVVLEIIRQKLNWEENMTAPVVLTKLDDFLSLLGMNTVSVLELWENASELGDQRSLLHDAVNNVFRTVQTCCTRRLTAS